MRIITLPRLSTIAGSILITLGVVAAFSKPGDKTIHHTGLVKVAWAV